MKICHMEAMKEIRLLEEKKNKVINDEISGCTVSYKEGEEKVNTGYSYDVTREKIAELDLRIRKIKSALAAANCTVMLEDFNVTVGEGLVMLAQWNAEYSRLRDFANGMMQISRRITQNGILEYTECLFDTKKVAEDAEELKRKIGKLQVAIDRANLLNTIDIETE